MNNMDYAIIPTAQFINLALHYRVINQIFIGDENESVLLPYILLEDKFSQPQKDEIILNGGIVFESKEEYFEWLDNLTK